MEVVAVEVVAVEVIAVIMAATDCCLVRVVLAKR